MKIEDFLDACCRAIISGSDLCGVVTPISAHKSSDLYAKLEICRTGDHWFVGSKTICEICIQ